MSSPDGSIPTPSGMPRLGGRSDGPDERQERQEQEQEQQQQQQERQEQQDRQERQGQQDRQEQRHHDSSIPPPSDGLPRPGGRYDETNGRKDHLRDQEERSQQQPTTEDGESNFLIKLSESLPTHGEIQAFLSSPGCGAVSTFTGITRDNFEGKRVTHLSYEGYVPMAIKELRSLCRDAREKYQTVERLVAVHILGDCPVGEASVVVGCSSPHRREAIRCTEYLIDELKGRVPIWKREVYEGDGGSVWKENSEWREGRRRRVMVKEEKGKC